MDEDIFIVSIFYAVYFGALAYFRNAHVIGHSIIGYVIGIPCLIGPVWLFDNGYIESHLVILLLMTITGGSLGLLIVPKRRKDKEYRSADHTPNDFQCAMCHGLIGNDCFRFTFEEGSYSGEASGQEGLYIVKKELVSNIRRIRKFACPACAKGPYKIQKILTYLWISLFLICFGGMGFSAAFFGNNEILYLVFLPIGLIGVFVGMYADKDFVFDRIRNHGPGIRYVSTLRERIVEGKVVEESTISIKSD